jgi:hypothetical protein
MKFEEVVARIGTLTDVRRIASAHVVDHGQLRDEELRDALIKTKNQYVHPHTVRSSFDDAVNRDTRESARLLSRLILVDVLLEQYECTLPFAETEAKALSIEQGVLNRSNELDLDALACGDKSTPRHRDLDVYDFVLKVAWEHRDSVSPDEANLLSNLRRHLAIDEYEHRILEAKLKKFPKPGNELHTRTEINAARRNLQQAGLLFAIRLEDGMDRDVLPDELAAELRTLVGLELRTDAYRELLKFHKLRRKAHLTELLERASVVFGKNDGVEALVERVIRKIPPSKAIANASPRYGLSSEELGDWCAISTSPLTVPSRSA